MVNNERWLATWKSYMYFMLKNKRRPSRHRVEDKILVNWAKQNRKMRNKGIMNKYRKRMFEMLIAEADSLRRLNQYVYAGKDKYRDPNLSE